ncbi:membrane protein [Streptomyces badius]
MRRMKLTALGLLLFVALVYSAGQVAGPGSGAGPWAGYVAAAAEAGMVGAMADWFAVTTLFRHPLACRSAHRDHPHQEGPAGGVAGRVRSARTSSPEDVVRQRLRAVGIGSRLGAWLADPEHADRVTAELSAALRGALTVLRDSDVQAVVGEAITRRADAQEIAPGIGKMLEKIVADGGHRRVVDLVVARAHDWLVAPRPAMDAVQGGAPGWTPPSSTRRSASGSTRSSCGCRDRDAGHAVHPARGALDRFLRDFASDLQGRRHTRAGRAAQGRGAGARRGPGPDRVRVDRRTVDDRVRRRGRAQ